VCLYVSYSATTFPNTISPKATKATALPLYHIGPEIAWESTVNYELSSNTEPNGLYAINSPHPSQRAIAKDVNNADVFLDSEIGFKDPGNMTSFSYKPTLESDEFFIGSTVHDTHLYGYATCENLGVCPTGAVLGEGCHYTQPGSGDVHSGFCYKAADSSLQCGRSTEVEGKFGLAHKNVHGIARCAAGIPLATPGKLVTRRMLIGGCMVTNDASYTPYADVHVPDTCVTPSTPGYLKTGCMFPGATNYVHGAVHSGVCHYGTRGCMSPTALNYNPEASISDYCVQPVLGCTLKTASFYGVDTATPGYLGLHVGVPTTNVGTITLPSIGNVKTYDVGANVLSGCEVVIEGCMDPTAVNYDSRANSQTYTWCVPSFPGCMMPTQKVQSTSMNTLSEGTYTRSHAKDSGSANFDPSATVNQLSQCVVGRVGCMSSTAHNYDPKATFNEGCYEAAEGCLDRTALNFNCTTKVGITQCTDNYPPATNHSEVICTYGVSPPPAASPSIPAGAASTLAVVVELLVEGDVSDYDNPTFRAAYIQAYADKFNVDPALITLVITPASVNLAISIQVPDAAAGTALQSQIDAAMGSTPASASSFLAQAGGLPSIRVLRAPVVESKVVVLVGPPSPPPSVPVGAIVGGVIGGIFPTLIAGGAYYMYKKKKAAKVTYPA
jgi:hypothetical protein